MKRQRQNGHAVAAQLHSFLVLNGLDDMRVVNLVEKVKLSVKVGSQLVGGCYLYHSPLTFWITFDVGG